MIKFKYDKNLCNWYFTLDDNEFYITDTKISYYNNKFSYGLYQRSNLEQIDILTFDDDKDIRLVIDDYVKSKKLRLEFKCDNKYFYNRLDFEYTLVCDLDNLTIKVYKRFHSCIFKNVDTLEKAKELASEYITNRILPQQLSLI